MELLWGFLTFVAALWYYLYYTYFRGKPEWWPKRGVENIKTEGLIARIMRKDMVGIDGDMYKQSPLPFGGFFEMGTPMLLVRDLDLVKNILVKDFDHFAARVKIETDDIMKDMLSNREGKDWKDMRAKVTPTFTTGKIKNVFPIMSESGKRLNSYLKDISSKNSGSVDMELALGHFALDVICAVVLGIDGQVFSSNESVVAIMAKRLNISFSPMMVLKMITRFLTPNILKKIIPFRVLDQKAVDYFSQLILNVIQQRETSGERRNDFLQILIDLKHGKLQADEQSPVDSGDKANSDDVTDDFIVANCLQFIFAGFDTVRMAITFGTYALALNQPAQEKLRKELQKAIASNNGELSYDIVSLNEYLDKFVNESMRMYPNLRIMQKCTKDYPVAGSEAVIPKDTYIVMSVYQIHHDEKHYPNPEVFDPENFSRESKEKRHPYAFLPFGQGPRMCIGNRFALIEVKTFIANLVLNFEVEPNAKTCIPMKFTKAPMLKPANGLWLNVKPIQ